QAEGDIAGAKPLLERALTIRENAFGVEDLRVATSLFNLAMLLQAKDDLAGALPLLQRALTIREKLLGPELLVVFGQCGLGELDGFGGSTVEKLGGRIPLPSRRRASRRAERNNSGAAATAGRHFRMA